MSPWPRSDARELREEVDRRLSAPSRPSEACLAACPGLHTLDTDITAVAHETILSVELSATGDHWADYTEFTMDALCTDRPTVQCVVDNPSACCADLDDFGGSVCPDATTDAIFKFAPSLDCICDACPSARPAIAHFEEVFVSNYFSSGSFGTTTQAFDAGNTTDIGDGGFDDPTGEDMEMMCFMYPLLSCPINQPTQCGGGILSTTSLNFMYNAGILMSGGIPNVTADELAQLEETCPNATMTNGTGGDDDDSSSDSSPPETPETPEGESDSSSTTILEEASNCGFISLGWLSASVPLMVTALRFEAAR